MSILPTPSCQGLCCFRVLSGMGAVRGIESISLQVVYASFLDRGRLQSECGHLDNLASIYPTVGNQERPAVLRS